MNPFLQTLKNLGPGRLIVMGGVLIGMIAFFVFIAGRMATPGMAMLYSGLSTADAAAIAQQLDSQKIPYEVSSDGSSISVANTNIAKLRMQLAGEGLPRGGNIGYEIFDQPEGFGTTSFVQSINHLRALEGELARTVGTLGPVQQARVHLVMPKRELFGRNEQRSTASVFLRLRGGASLSKEQIAAIQNLVSASVPQLEPDQISIVDDRGNLLARAQGANAAANGGNNMIQSQEEMRISLEATQAAKIEELLSKTLGYGRVRAQVSADVDFDRITTNSESFDPDGQVVRSTQTTTDESNEGGAADGTVSITNNLPNADAGAGAAGGGTSSNRSEETVNYEISKTVKQHVREVGLVKRLSIAVLVDGNYTKAEDGTETYAPRSDAEMAQIKALVRSAVNFDEKRGDSLEVVNMRFAPIDVGPITNNDILGLPKGDIMRLAESLILAIVAILVMLLVVRPLIKRAFEVMATQPAADPGQMALPGAQQRALPGGAQPALAAPTGDPNMNPEELEQLVDISRVEGRVRASAVKKVGEIIDKHPEESVSVLRNWIYQEGRQ